MEEKRIDWRLRTCAGALVATATGWAGLRVSARVARDAPRGAQESRGRGGPRLATSFFVTRPCLLYCMLTINLDRALLGALGHFLLNSPLIFLFFALKS